MELRRSELRPNPERVRDWLKRSRTGRAKLRGDSTLRRETPLAPGKRKRRAKVSGAMRARVFGRQAGRCLVCRDRKPTTIHHVLPVQRWPDLELTEDNMVGLCWPCHDAHERALPRVPRVRLPQRAIDLARRTGPDAAGYIERTYPK